MLVIFSNILQRKSQIFVTLLRCSKRNTKEFCGDAVSIHAKSTELNYLLMFMLLLLINELEYQVNM